MSIKKNFTAFDRVQGKMDEDRDKVRHWFCRVSKAHGEWPYNTPHRHHQKINNCHVGKLRVYTSQLGY